MAELIARKLKVFGRVQGVFFRQGAVNEARRLGIDGWVCNASDGTVEAYIKGEEPAIEQMIGWMRRGPSNARVDDVSIQPTDLKELIGFSVRI